MKRHEIYFTHTPSDCILWDDQDCLITVVGRTRVTVERFAGWSIAPFQMVLYAAPQGRLCKSYACRKIATGSVEADGSLRDVRLRIPGIPGHTTACEEYKYDTASLRNIARTACVRVLETFQDAVRFT